VVILAIAGLVARRITHDSGRAAARNAAAMAESLDVATAREDWDQALAWAIELADCHPESSVVQRKLAVALHQYAWVKRPGVKRPRLPLRTSLDRIECEQRVMAAADSARVLARSAEDWVGAVWWHGQSFEHLGLPLEALDAYSRIERDYSYFLPAGSRAREIRGLLRDPVGGADDKSEVNP
jgi:hypothetical protein